MANDNDDDDGDYTERSDSRLLGMTGTMTKDSARLRDVAHDLVHEIDVVAVNVIAVYPDPERGASSSSCISHRVPDHYNADVASRLAAAMRKCADEIEQWCATSIDGGSKH